MKNFQLALRIIAVFLISFPALAIGFDGEQCADCEEMAESTTALKTWNSAYGGGTKVAISTHGNLINFESPKGYEHIYAGSLCEGYVLCYSGKSAYDLGVLESNFGAPYNVTTSPVSLTRNTSDGWMSLKQTYIFSGPNKSLEITMVLKNNTGTTLSGVVLRRQVDFDTDTGGSNGWAAFINQHGANTNSGVFAYNDAASAPSGKRAHGMLLKHVIATTVPYDRFFAGVTDLILDSRCTPALRRPTPAKGDYGNTLGYNIGSMGPGQSKTIKILYTRF